MNCKKMTKVTSYRFMQKHLNIMRFKKTRKKSVASILRNEYRAWYEHVDTFDSPQPLHDSAPGSR